MSDQARETNDTVGSSSSKAPQEAGTIVTGSNQNASHHTNNPSHHTRRDEEIKRRRLLFGDCALIEIIHLHDCLRGAIKALKTDVDELAQHYQTDATTSSNMSHHHYSEHVCELERRVAGRFKVIWSVFRAHSTAEDEFIWPALQSKTQGRINGGQQQQQQQQQQQKYTKAGAGEQPSGGASSATTESKMIEKEEYEEDHADEERMFSEMDRLLNEFREYLVRANNNTDEQERPAGCSSFVSAGDTMNGLAKAISDQTAALSQHLMAHLEKEETECMPLVVKHLSKSEIHDLVGQIMGKRSADTIAQIMTMAVQNLDEENRLEMVKYMKQAMSGTYFDRWLLMSGWMSSSSSSPLQRVVMAEAADGDRKDDDDNDKQQVVEEQDGDRKRSAVETVVQQQAATVLVDSAATTSNAADATATAAVVAGAPSSKRVKTEEPDAAIGTPVQSTVANVASASAAVGTAVAASGVPCPPATRTTATATTVGGITSQSELEKFIRAIATNPGMTPQQKNSTIQGLRDSVWKSNQRHREINQGPPTVVNAAANLRPPTFPLSTGPGRGEAAFGLVVVPGTTASVTRRFTPPSMYYKKNSAGKVELVWNGDATSPPSAAPPPRGALDSSNTTSTGGSVGGSAASRGVPLFSATELAPTFHDGAASSKLGCPHYARGCKLRHPKSGRLYACRVCCEQERELPTKDKDEPLDRYAVTEVMCMKCHALQPAEDRCINPDCEGSGKPFAKYFCRICHLYDDGVGKSIFHCPYCNCCRLGQGLGIDFRHCMRCNACVSLSDDDHQCIPQKLQGSCPICHESLFQSTEPLRGLKCGHVMHLSCFTEYRRGHSYTCPLCMRSMEDMTDYFTMLDTAVRMQPMPAAYLSTMSNTYCQDCGKTGQVQYHFVGLKCASCGSYNTREMGRVDISR